ncbi:hypothetical protein [Spirosoma knui]
MTNRIIVILCRVHTPLLVFAMSLLLLAGCSKWNVAPKELEAVSTLPNLQVSNVDVFAISGRGWSATFTLNLDPKPNVAIKELGVCYSSTNKLPSLVDATGATATAKAKDVTLPNSIGVLVTVKTTYYYRGYALFEDGRVSYSKVDSFAP